jgi:hypothetical protein
MLNAHRIRQLNNYNYARVGEGTNHHRAEEFFNSLVDQ